MYQSIDFSQLGGMYTDQSTLDYLQKAYGSVLDALADSYGDLVIVSGLVVSGNNVSSGWIVYNKQLYPVTGGVLQGYLYVVNTVLPEQFADGSTKNVYSSSSLVFTNTNTGIAWTDVQRLPFATTSLLDAFTAIQGMMNKMLFNEPVIFSGCLVGAGTISAGSVYINGKLQNSPAYTGVFPVYLNSNAVFTNVLPTSPYILFDGGTSQYYADVVRRNTTYSGQTFTHTNQSELAFFDVTTGLGKWRWKGFKISDLLESRIPIGYSRHTTNNDALAWDSAYQTVGNFGGENNHILSVTEMPAHSHGLPDVYSETGNAGHIASGGSSREGVMNDSTASTGGGQAHNNRQPWRVVIQIEKI